MVRSKSRVPVGANLNTGTSSMSSRVTREADGAGTAIATSMPDCLSSVASPRTYFSVPPMESGRYQATPSSTRIGVAVASIHDLAPTAPLTWRHHSAICSAAG